MSPERKIVEKFPFARQERAAVSVLQSETVPPNLAEICSKGRKTRRLRSSRATDRVICGLCRSTIDNLYLSMARRGPVHHKE